MITSLVAGKLDGHTSSTFGRLSRLSRHLVRGVCGGLVSLALIGPLAFGFGGRCVAQDQSGTARLTVRPRTAAAVTQNPKAGEYPLRSAGYVMVVPQPCAGAQRCPLVVFLVGTGDSTRGVTTALRPVAEKYGFLLLAASRYEPSVVDTALGEALRTFAVDPDKIGIFGGGGAGRASLIAGAGAAAMRLGIDNMDIFNRIGSISGGYNLDGIDQRDSAVKFYIGQSIGEYGQAELWLTRDVPAKILMNFRGLDPREEDYDFWGQWLHASWTPSATATAPVALASESPSRLTADMLKQMTTFWTRFMQEPESIRTTARRAHLREVSNYGVMGDNHAVLMTDMAALAAKYPSVAADLQTAGLTAEQHDAYRLSLLVDAHWTQAFGSDTEYPVLDHPDQFLALWATGMFATP